MDNIWVTSHFILVYDFQSRLNPRFSIAWLVAMTHGSLPFRSLTIVKRRAGLWTIATCRMKKKCTRLVAIGWRRENWAARLCRLWAAARVLSSTRHQSPCGQMRTRAHSTTTRRRRAFFLQTQGNAGRPLSSRRSSAPNSAQQLESSSNLVSQAFHACSSIRR